MVVVMRISPPEGGRKSTASMCRKAAVLGSENGEYPRTPPGSLSRACIHRGNSGTGESRLSPCTSTVGGTDLSNRETPGDEEEAFALHRANKERRYKVSGEDSEERTSLRWAVGSLSGT